MPWSVIRTTFESRISNLVSVSVLGMGIEPSCSAWEAPLRKEVMPAADKASKSLMMLTGLVMDRKLASGIWVELGSLGFSDDLGVYISLRREAIVTIDQQYSLSHPKQRVLGLQSGAR